MSEDIRFKPFKQQKEFLKDNHRIRCLFAAKRGGKSEAAYIDTIIKATNQPGYEHGKDPYLIAIVAPTQDMLTRLVWPKFKLFADHMCKRFVSKPDVFEFENGSVIYGISAEKINRMEGLKLYHIHLTEAFQMKQVALLESMARTTDTKGSITIDGSLGPQLINPKQHWLYQMFKDKTFPDAKVWEWTTLDNPHVDKEEIERQKQVLDPTTFRSMYEIVWDTIPINAVYHEFSDFNVMDNYVYNPALPTYVAIDWGWAHPMAVGFFQVDARKDTVYLFDEIVSSKLKIDTLYDMIMAKPYNITDWCCDIVGNQEREQTGRSNIKVFEDKGIEFKKRRTAVTYGIPIVRSYIKNSKGRARFFISKNCTKSVDGMRQYRYNEKDGIIQNENPIKLDDDAVDMIRYFFVNFMDDSIEETSAMMIPRRGL